MSAVHGRCDERFAAIKALAENLAVEDQDGFAIAGAFAYQDLI